MVIDKLPAKIFSNLIDILSKDKTKIFKLENKALENIKLNFYIKEVAENVVGVLFSNDQLLSNALEEEENNSLAT